MNSQTRLKIGQIEPKSSNFELLFQIVQITKQSGDQIHCRIVDDTGIANAYFDKFASKLKKGGVFLMTNLNSNIIDGSIRIEMSGDTQISKQPDKIIFKDKSNDISKKKYNATNSKDQQQKVLKSTSNKVPQTNAALVLGISTKKSEETQQCLIPLTKEQALAQLKQKKQFDQLFKNKIYGRNKQKDKGQFREKDQTQNPQSHKTKQKHFQPKQKEIKKEQINEKKKFTQKLDHKQTHLNDHKVSYKSKQAEQQKYQGGRIQKAKSLLYKQKVENNPVQPKKKNFKQKIEQKKEDKPYENKNKEEQKNNLKQTENLNQGSETKYETGKGEVSHFDQNEKQKKLNALKRQGQSIDIIKILDQVGKHVQLRAFVTEKQKKVDGTQELDRQIADSTGSVWLRTSKFHLESKQVYQFENLQVFKEQQRVFLKQSQLSEAKRVQVSIPFNMRDINGKQ